MVDSDKTLDERAALVMGAEDTLEGIAWKFPEKLDFGMLDLWSIWLKREWTPSSSNPTGLWQARMLVAKCLEIGEGYTLHCSLTDTLSHSRGSWLPILEGLRTTPSKITRAAVEVLEAHQKRLDKIKTRLAKVKENAAKGKNNE